MKPRLYVETTVLSYLAARPARDVVSLARQEMTRDEVSKGDEAAAFRRLEYANQCSVLPEDPHVVNVANRLMEIDAVPKTEPEDAAHIAIATLAQVKYIVSWNFAHMVSPQAKRQLEKAIISLGFSAPLLGIPEEIFEAEAP